MHCSLLLLLLFNVVGMVKPQQTKHYSSASLLIEMFVRKLTTNWPMHLSKVEWEQFNPAAGLEEIKRQYEGTTTTVTIQDQKYMNIPLFMDWIWMTVENETSRTIGASHSYLKLVTGYEAFYQLYKLIELLVRGFNERMTKELGTHSKTIDDIKLLLIHMREATRRAVNGQERMVREMCQQLQQKIKKVKNYFQKIELLAQELLHAAGVEWPSAEMNLIEMSPREVQLLDEPQHHETQTFLHISGESSAEMDVEMSPTGEAQVLKQQIDEEHREKRRKLQ